MIGSFLRTFGSLMGVYAAYKCVMAIESSIKDNKANSDKEKSDN